MSDRNIVRLGALFAALCLVIVAGGPARAQSDWPTRTITMIVPYAAGGGADPVARLIADGMGKKLGQSIVVEFRPGANATLGTRDVAKAASDGYTILFTPPTPIVNVKFMMSDLGYDPEHDFTPIVNLTNSPNAIIASGKFEAKTLKDFIDYAKRNPGKMNVGVPALGGGGHLAMALVEQTTGTDFNIVPYKGTGELLPDILSGTLDASADLPAAYVPHAKSGAVRMLAIFSDQRVPAFPDVPTATEQGFPQLQLGAWFGLFGPKNLPRPIVDKINEAANEQLKNPQIRSRIEALGYQIEGGTPEDFTKAVSDAFVTVGALVKKGHISMQ